MKIEELYEIYKNHPSVNTDTRSIEKGQLFFALKGANFNGNQYASQALEKGAAFAVIDEEAFKVSDQYILVEDVLTTLQVLSNHHRKQLSIPVLGITGSNGKTTTKELINAVLSKKYRTLATKGNLNNHIGVPLTLLSINDEVEFAIIEMGANKPGDIKELCDIAEPDYGLITNIGKAHLEGFGGLEGVIQTKSQLYDHIRAKQGTIFLNATNEILAKVSQGIDNKVNYLGEGSVINATLLPSSGFLMIDVEGKTIETKLVGDYNFENAAAALGIGKYFEVKNDDALAALEAYTPSNNRSQLIKKGSNTIIMDAYNANPSSMRAAIENFIASTATNKHLILGDMLEVGKYAAQEHADIASLASSKGLTPFFVGKEFYKSKKGPNYFMEKEELKDYLAQHKIENATILIKGSRGMKLEELQDFLS